MPRTPVPLSAAAGARPKALSRGSCRHLRRRLSLLEEALEQVFQARPLLRSQKARPRETPPRCSCASSFKWSTLS